jgi:hypothetical protein
MLGGDMATMTPEVKRARKKYMNNKQTAKKLESRNAQALEY